MRCYLVKGWGNNEVKIKIDRSFMQQVQSAAGRAGPVVSADSAVTSLSSPGKLKEFSDNVRGRGQLGEASVS